MGLYIITINKIHRIFVAFTLKLNQNVNKAKS